jgi:hypothetical protein
MKFHATIAAAVALASLGAAPPAGYPAAEPGYHWAVYPDGPYRGRWGLVQDGVTLGGCPDGNCPLRAGEPRALPPAVTQPQPPASPGDDALSEVNAKRASRGLRPFVRDEGLTRAARACAAFRAERLLFGHTSNDFAFVPPGTSCSSTGCAAYPASYGWLSCCVWDNYTFAGAAWVTGRDGKRYMHLFVR